MEHVDVPDDRPPGRPGSSAVLGRSLAEADPEVHAAIGRETLRQQRTLEMIASENFAPEAVMAAHEIELDALGYRVAALAYRHPLYPELLP